MRTNNRVTPDRVTALPNVIVAKDTSRRNGSRPLRMSRWMSGAGPAQCRPRPPKARKPARRPGSRKETREARKETREAWPKG
jgi:hypothetical protein